MICALLRAARRLVSTVKVQNGRLTTHTNFRQRRRRELLSDTNGHPQRRLLLAHRASRGAEGSSTAESEAEKNFLHLHCVIWMYSYLLRGIATTKMLLRQHQDVAVRAQADSIIYCHKDTRILAMDGIRVFFTARNSIVSKNKVKESSATRAISRGPELRLPLPIPLQVRQSDAPLDFPDGLHHVVVRHGDAHVLLSFS